jgi:hypothetical protein
MQTQHKAEQQADALLADIEVGKVDPGPQDRGVSGHQYTHEDFLDRFARYEAAVKRVYQDHDSDGLKELESARQSLADISRKAHAAFDAKHVPAEGDRLFGKALKDWATAMMENRGVTRAVAREKIMLAIQMLTAREYPALTPNVVREYELIDPYVVGETDPRVHAMLPTDHLPEGSH